MKNLFYQIFVMSKYIEPCWNVSFVEFIFYFEVIIQARGVLNIFKMAERRHLVTYFVLSKSDTKSLILFHLSYTSLYTLVHSAALSYMCSRRECSEIPPIIHDKLDDMLNFFSSQQVLLNLVFGILHPLLHVHWSKFRIFFVIGWLLKSCLKRYQCIGELH